METKDILFSLENQQPRSKVQSFESVQSVGHKTDDLISERRIHFIYVSKSVTSDVTPAFYARLQLTDVPKYTCLYGDERYPVFTRR